MRSSPLKSGFAPSWGLGSWRVPAGDCLRYELQSDGFLCESQLGLPVVYHGVKLDLGYRIDLLVQDLVVVEIKSVEVISPVHQASVISYLKLSGKLTASSQP